MITPTDFVKRSIKQLVKKRDKFIIIENSINPEIFVNYLCTPTGKSTVRKIIQAI